MHKDIIGFVGKVSSCKIVSGLFLSRKHS